MSLQVFLGRFVRALGKCTRGIGNPIDGISVVAAPRTVSGKINRKDLANAELELTFALPLLWSARLLGEGVF